MPIASLYFTDIGPFDEIEFEFDRQVNVFTGPNGHGPRVVSGAVAVVLMVSVASRCPNWLRPVGSEPRIVPGPRVVDARQIAPHSVTDVSPVRPAPSRLHLPPTKREVRP